MGPLEIAILVISIVAFIILIISVLILYFFT